MIQYEHLIGRLVVARASSPLTDAEFDRYDLQRGKTVRAICSAGLRIVSFTDVREVRVISQPHAERLVSILRGNNSFLARGVFVLSTSSLSLQIARIIREANNSARRYFSDVSAAEAWLAEELTPEEQRHLHEFSTTKGHSR